jgi:hypothetical protein
MMRSAYRDVDGEHYVILWPSSLTEFGVLQGRSGTRAQSDKVSECKGEFSPPEDICRIADHPLRRDKMAS